MSERFRSPLESVHVDEKSMWLAHPVTKELIRTIDQLRATRERYIVATVSTCAKSGDEIDISWVRTQGAAIVALEELKEHILYAGERNVAS